VAGKQDRRTPRPDGIQHPYPVLAARGRAANDSNGLSRLSSALGDVLLQTLVNRRGAALADPTGSAREAKKWRRLAAPPSLGRKRPRKQTARPRVVLLRCTI
jgi:hypothetical protein